ITHSAAHHPTCAVPMLTKYERDVNGVVHSTTPIAKSSASRCPPRLRSKRELELLYSPRSLESLFGTGRTSDGFDVPPRRNQSRHDRAEPSRSARRRAT